MADEFYLSHQPSLLALYELASRLVSAVRYKVVRATQGRPLRDIISNIMT